MADISKIKVPSSNTPYDIKDADARSRLTTVENTLAVSVQIFVDSSGYISANYGGGN